MSKIEGLNNTPMAVTAKNRALIQAAMSDSMIDQMLVGAAFLITEAEVTPTGANDFMALKNISNEYAVLTRFAMYATNAETFTGSLALNYAIGGTNALPEEAFNRSGGAIALSERMQVAVGVTVTGTGSVLSTPLTFTSSATTRYQNILDDSTVIVIPPGHCLTLGASAGTASLTGLKAELHFIAEPFVDGK